MKNMRTTAMEQQSGRKLIITSDLLPVPGSAQKSEFQIAALWEQDRILELTVQPKVKAEDGLGSILNNIYIARVQNVTPALNAAFVEISKGLLCYLPLEELKNPLFTRKLSKKTIAQGDELAVQVIKEAVRSKGPVVTANLGFPGEFLVLTSGNCQIGVSSRLPKESRDRLWQLAETLPGTGTEFGIIMRTNAASASDEQILDEFNRLKQELVQVKNTAATRTAFSCLYREQPFYLKALMDIRKEGLGEVVTDDPDIYRELEQMPASFGRYGIRLYEDSMWPLPRLYNIPAQAEAAQKERVWLKSGANIVIQPTEALTVIDVNSGKNTSKKKKNLYHYDINLEAAEEIARQLRLRNLSGIIIIDFIDMYDETLDESLLAKFQGFLRADPVPTRLADMTKLGLVEVTRKKIRRSLREMLLAGSAQ